MLNPTRLLILGDTHHDLEWTLHALKVAKQQQCDAVVQVGDFGFFPHKDFGQAFLQGLGAVLSVGDIPLYFIRGNHDNTVALNQLPVGEDGFAPVSENLIYIPNTTRWTWAGVKFGAMGGAVSVDAAMRTEGESWWRDETISYQEAMRFCTGAKLDVLLTHDAPSGVGMGMHGKLDLASAGHRESVRAILEDVAPQVMFHGHYHEFHDTMCEHENGVSRVIGLGMNSTPEKGEGSYRVLDLPSLSIR